MFCGNRGKAIAEPARTFRVPGSDGQTRPRAAVLAGESPARAAVCALEHGFQPAVVLEKAELAVSPWRLRGIARAERVDVALLHTADLRRQPMPQLYSFALACMPVRERLIHDERSGATHPVGRPALTRAVARTPLEVCAGLLGASREAARFAMAGFARPRIARRQAGAGSSVLAIWLGASGSPVGGSITHVSGILKGFSEVGMDVCVITGQEPPEQLRRAANRIVVIPPPAAGHRLLGFAGALAMNRRLMELAGPAVSRLRPAFIYQRHAAFLVAGAELCDRFGIPLVLEWNASEAWARAHFKRRLPGEQVFNPLLRSMERSVAARADVVAAVSDHAADMALAAGARRDCVIVAPNGVDMEEISAVERPSPHDTTDASLVGWIGSFGSWHGAEILIRATPLLPDTVRVLMIGDGPRRRGCELLATQLRVAGRIEWTGTVPHDVALRRLASCDVLASPHVPLEHQPFFGSPTKLFEYMGLGRPIVASSLEQLGEVLEHGRTAFLVPPADPVLLANGISEVLASPDRGAGLGRAARREAEQRHTWAARARQILEAVEQF